MAQVGQSQEQTKGKETVLDPIAYRTENQGPVTEQTKNWNWNPEQLKNADINLSAYGDDSSSVNYNNPELWGGQNQKYTGENTKNTTVQYNKDATIEGLNPDYAFGRKAQMVNSGDAGYIQRRNDEIASALYNEGITDVDAVRNYLMQQEGFLDSEANERENTTQSVWKRIGQIAEQNKKPEQQQEEKKPFAEDTLVKDTGGKIYGKDTADTGDPLKGINTLADANSVYKKMEEARIGNVNALRSMDPSNAAALTYSGTTPYGETAMRDIQSLDPEWYAQYKQSLQKLYTQDVVDDISHGSADQETKTFVDTTEETIENDIKTFEEKNTSDETHEGAGGILNNLLKSNQVATSAKQEMMNIKKDLADLNTQLEELPGQANKLFKGDVPQYLVQAYISNNSQKIQSKIKNLENRYSSLSDMYKTEVSQAQREAEYNLKMAEYQRALTNDAYDREYKSNKLLQDSVQWINGVPFSFDAKTRSYMQLDDNTALYQYNTKVGIQSEWGMSLVGKKTGLECEGYTDKQANATAGVTMVGANSSTANWKDKVRYATGGGFIGYYDKNGNPVWDQNGNIYYGNADVYDLIPQVGDIAVGVGGPYNKQYGHTMFIDSVWKNEQGEWMFHYTATNKSSKPGEYTVGYEGTKSLSEFMSNGGIGFWNPYKQAQYNGQSQEQVNEYSPMQPTIDRLLDEYKASGKTNMFSELGKFQELYTNLYQADKDGTLSAMIDSGVLGTFLTNVAFNWAQNQGGDLALGDDKGVKNFLKLAGDEMLLEAESYVAKNGGFIDDPQAQKAYDGFRKMVRAIQIKLRDESGAAINKSERATDFLLFLPKASDSKEQKLSKLNDMEEYLRRMGTDAGINSKEYIKLNLGKLKSERSYE